MGGHYQLVARIARALSPARVLFPPARWPKGERPLPARPGAWPTYLDVQVPLQTAIMEGESILHGDTASCDGRTGGQRATLVDLGRVLILAKRAVRPASAWNAGGRVMQNETSPIVMCPGCKTEMDVKLVEPLTTDQRMNEITYRCPTCETETKRVIQRS
jgi:hypothetical protein